MGHVSFVSPEKGFGFAPLEEAEGGVIWVFRRVVLTAALFIACGGSMAEARRAGREAGICLGSAAEKVVRRWLPNELGLREQGIQSEVTIRIPHKHMGGLVLGEICFPVSI